jgi:hypothetical protein
MGDFGRYLSQQRTPEECHRFLGYLMKLSKVQNSKESQAISQQIWSFSLMGGNLLGYEVQKFVCHGTTVAIHLIHLNSCY